MQAERVCPGPLRGRLPSSPGWRGGRLGLCQFKFYKHFYFPGVSWGGERRSGAGAAKRGAGPQHRGTTRPVRTRRGRARDVLRPTVRSSVGSSCVPPGWFPSDGPEAPEASASPAPRCRGGRQRQGAGSAGKGLRSARARLRA